MITAKRPPPTFVEKQRFFGMALWIDHDRGKAGRLAKSLYRSKFGVWPQGLRCDPIFPDRAFLNYEKALRVAYTKQLEKRRTEEPLA